MASGIGMHSRLATKGRLEQHWRGLLLFCVCLLGGGAFVLAGLNIRSAIFSPFAVTSSGETLSAVAEQLDISALLPPNTVTSPTINAPSTTTVGLPPGSAATTPTAAELRAILKQSGATDVQLAELTDEQLLQAYGVAAGFSSSTSSDAATTTPATVPSKEALLALPAASVRELLQQSGVSAATLQGLSDEQVVNLFRDTINKLAAPAANNLPVQP